MEQQQQKQKQKYKWLQWLALFWLGVFLLLCLAAAYMPQIIEVEDTGSHEYTHAEDGYTLVLDGTWQVSKAKEKELLLLDAENDSTIRFMLEVGGYDYLSLSRCAKKTIAAVEKEQDITFDANSPAVAGGIYKGIRFAGSIEQDGKAYTEEFFIFHLNEGIRLYAVYAHPAGIKQEKTEEASAIITSILFTDFNEVYKKYL